MSTSTELKELRRRLVNQAASKERAIRRYGRSHDSLCSFRGCVEKSYYGNAQENEAKKELISSLAGLRNECRCADKYASGMEDTLSGLGLKALGLVFSGLDVSISIKKKLYETTIDATEIELNLLQVRISALDEQIELAEKLEAIV